MRCLPSTRRRSDVGIASIAEAGVYVLLVVWIVGLVGYHALSLTQISDAAAETEDRAVLLSLLTDRTQGTLTDAVSLEYCGTDELHHDVMESLGSGDVNLADNPCPDATSAEHATPFWAISEPLTQSARLLVARRSPHPLPQPDPPDEVPMAGDKPLHSETHTLCWPMPPDSYYAAACWHVDFDGTVNVTPHAQDGSWWRVPVVETRYPHHDERYGPFVRQFLSHLDLQLAFDVFADLDIFRDALGAFKADVDAAGRPSSETLFSCYVWSGDRYNPLGRGSNLADLMRNLFDVPIPMSADDATWGDWLTNPTTELTITLGLPRASWHDGQTPPPPPTNDPVCGAPSGRTDSYLTTHDFTILVPA